ncbi:hypothetical protein ACG74X_18785 [Marivita sp. S0852]
MEWDLLARHRIIQHAAATARSVHEIARRGFADSGVDVDMRNAPDAA